MHHPRHQASPVAFDLIKRFEGLRQDAARLPDGRWTVGYGHTASAREGAIVSEDDAEALLTYDLRQIGQAFDEAIFTPLTQNQVDALASFAFNIGLENFRASAVLRRINAGALLDAAFALEAWRKADLDGERIVVDALVRRRAAEKALFLTPQEGFVPAPTPIVEPRIDHGLDLAPPAIEPAPESAVDLSPPEAAAANLAARLRVILPEEPEPIAETFVEPAPGGDGGPANEPEPFPTIERAARPLTSEPAPEPTPEPVAAIPPPVAPSGNAEALRRAIFGQPEPAPLAEPGERNGLWPLAALGGVGMLVFLAAIVWAFRTKPAGGGPAPMNLGVIVVGVIGILCVASAVYFLLERLAGRDR